MKIALITNYWINSQGGGVKEYSKNLVQALKDKGADVVVLFREGEDTKNYKLPINKIKFVFESLRKLDEEKPDAILSQGGWFSEIPAGLYKKRHRMCKILVLFHTQADSSLPFYKRMFYTFLINEFDKVGFVSKALENNIRTVAKIKVKKDTFVLYGGAKAKKVRDEKVDDFRRKFNIPEDSTVLLGLGLTALEYKAMGAKLLIQGVKKLLDDDYEDVILILTRDGSYSGMLRKFTKKIGIEKHIIFTGDVSDPFIPLALSDIYTHITLGEGLPIALLEAMAMGKPIIATAVGGIPEAIENERNGILVEAHPEKIADAIKKLIINRSLRLKLGIEAKKTVENKFNWEKTAERLLEILKSS